MIIYIKWTELPSVIIVDCNVYKEYFFNSIEVTLYTQNLFLIICKQLKLFI